VKQKAYVDNPTAFSKTNFGKVFGGAGESLKCTFAQGRATQHTAKSQPGVWLHYFVGGPS
jgi:hypothetical protein